MKLLSKYKKLDCHVEMPVFGNRSLYMYKTHMNNVVLPTEFHDFQEVIDKTLSKLKNRNDVCFITIDEKIVDNETHRRGGLHVDFNWFENITNHGSTGGHGGNGANGGHSSSGGHGGGRHGAPSEQEIRRRVTEKRRKKIKKVLDDKWYDEVKNGGMLLVSDYAACKVYKGEILGNINEGGCCANIQTDNLISEIMPANEVYYLNALGIHESLLIPQKVNRTLLRINFHHDYIFEAQ